MTESARLAVLAYHKIGRAPDDGPDSWYYVAPDVLGGQLDVLAAEGWRFVDVDAFVTGLERPESLSRQTALVTFDDASCTLVSGALPVLRERGVPAACFVPTGFVGRENTYDDGREPSDVTCNWDELRELQRGGVSIESHGVSHTWLSTLGAAEQEREIRASKEILESRLRSAVRLFAYPYSDHGGDPDRSAQLLEDAGYAAAFLCGGGPSWCAVPPGDRYRIDRVAMFRDTVLPFDA